MAGITLELNIIDATKDRFDQCKKISDRVQELNEVINSLMASILQRQVESVSSASHATRPRPVAPPAPTADQLVHPNYRSLNFKKQGKRKVDAMLEYGVAVPVTLETQLLYLSGDYGQRSEPSTEEPEIEYEEPEEYIPPPPPDNTAEVATQTKWRRSRGQLFKPMASARVFAMLQEPKRKRKGRPPGAVAAAVATQTAKGRPARSCGVQCYGMEGEDMDSSHGLSGPAPDAEPAVSALLRRTPGRTARTPTESLSRTSAYRPRSVWSSSGDLAEEQRRVDALNGTWQSEVSKFSPCLTDSFMSTSVMNWTSSFNAGER
jgi:hypothetical protein